MVFLLSIVFQSFSLNQFLITIYQHSITTKGKPHGKGNMTTRLMRWQIQRKMHSLNSVNCGIYLSESF